jgi:hypothetical protein
MDPIILAGIAIVAIILILRIFFGMAKLMLKIGVIVLVAIVIWRVFVMRG